ncbi:MAG: DUF805 domain-containing protein [Pseudomonadota bacterium]
MSDTSPSNTSQTPMDPKRPWITDPREFPSAMSWAESLTNPLGETSRLHFTRAWTALFFARVIWYLGFALLAMVFAAAGAQNAGSLVPPPWAFLILVVLTILASIVLHIRRLADAKRSPLWAFLVAIPAVALIVGLFIGIQSGAKEYGVARQAAALEEQGMSTKLIAVELERDGAAKLFARELILQSELRQLQNTGSETDGPVVDWIVERFMSDPSIFVAALGVSTPLSDNQKSAIESALEDVIEEREEEAAERESGDGAIEDQGESRGRRGGGNASPEVRLNGEIGRIRREWRGKLPDIDLAETSERGYAVNTGIESAIGFWALPSFFVMLWSLLWVGRLPSGGGTIKSRFEIDNAPSRD